MRDTRVVLKERNQAELKAVCKEVHYSMYLGKPGGSNQSVQLELVHTNGDAPPHSTRSLSAALTHRVQRSLTECSTRIPSAAFAHRVQHSHTHTHTAHTHANSRVVIFSKNILVISDFYSKSQSQVRHTKEIQVIKLQGYTEEVGYTKTIA